MRLSGHLPEHEHRPRAAGLGLSQGTRPARHQEDPDQFRPALRPRGALADPSLFIWLGLYEPGEALLERVQDAFQLHDLAVEDAHRAHQRPKLDRYGDSIFIVLRTAQFAGPAEELEFGETHLFVGPRYVVTVRHGSLKDHVGLRGRCEGESDRLALGPGYVLSSSSTIGK